MLTGSPLQPMHLASIGIDLQQFVGSNCAKAVVAMRAVVKYFILNILIITFTY